MKDSYSRGPLEISVLDLVQRWPLGLYKRRSQGFPGFTPGGETDAVCTALGLKETQTVCCVQTDKLSATHSPQKPVDWLRGMTSYISLEKFSHAKDWKS